MDAKLKKLMELAGTLNGHLKDEKTIFNEVCTVLSKLEKFAAKQQENKVYGPIGSCAKDLCVKLEKHLERYK